MKKSTALSLNDDCKFPSSVQLFKFCQKALGEIKKTRVHDQDLGQILDFNPSDCSHWKKGIKNIRSVFSLSKLATTIEVDATILYEIASGRISCDEGYFEHAEIKSLKEWLPKFNDFCNSDRQDLYYKSHAAIKSFATELQFNMQFETAPLYLPEILKVLNFIELQPIEMNDRLSRVLKVKKGSYIIQYKKGDLKPQTRLSIVKDIARIVLQAERSTFKSLETISIDQPSLFNYQMTLLSAEILCPKDLILKELKNFDNRKNIVVDLANLFWVPRFLINFQLQDLLRNTQPQPVKMKPKETSYSVSTSM